MTWTIGADGTPGRRLVFEGNTTSPANGGSGTLVNANLLGFRLPNVGTQGIAAL